jgi:hypothetical protein
MYRILKDYDTKEFDGDLDSKKSTLHSFKTDAIKVEKWLCNKIEEEFHSFIYALLTLLILKFYFSQLTSK